MPAPLNAQEALIYTMVTMSAVDRDMKDVEISRIGNLATRMPVFEGFDENSLLRLAQECGDMVSSESGLSDVLNMIGEAIPARLAETDYAVAVEIASADRNVKAEEFRFLDLLRDQFNLDKLTTAAIERGARARHAPA